MSEPAPLPLVALAEQAYEWHRRGMRDSPLARWMLAQLQDDSRNGAQPEAALVALGRVVDLYALAYGDPERLTNSTHAALFEVQRRWLLALASQYRDRIGYSTVAGRS